MGKRTVHLRWPPLRLAGVAPATAGSSGDTNGPLAIGLSFFPLTAPVTLSIRTAFTSIPIWQLSLNVVVLVSFALAALWLAGRTFRLGMLRYGKRLSWREVFSKANPQ